MEARISTIDSRVPVNIHWIDWPMMCFAGSSQVDFPAPSNSTLPHGHIHCIYNLPFGGRLAMSQLCLSLNDSGLAGLLFQPADMKT